MCYDEKAYYNGESKVLDNSFIDTFFENKNTPQYNTTIDESNIIIENLKKWINKKESFINGNRNNFITQLARNCNFRN